MWPFSKPVYFISEIEIFLQKFDQKHLKLSLSQQKEKEKHRFLSIKRDFTKNSKRDKKE